MVVPLTENLPPATLLGVLLSLRQIIPNVGGEDSSLDTMKGSFGAKIPYSEDKEPVSDIVDEAKLLKANFLSICRIVFFKCLKNQIIYPKNPLQKKVST